jgi:hypothetical protein
MLSRKLFMPHLGICMSLIRDKQNMKLSLLSKSIIRKLLTHTNIIMWLMTFINSTEKFVYKYTNTNVSLFIEESFSLVFTKVL